MAKVQTRRTISLNRALHDLVHAAAAREKKSDSQWLSEVVRERLVGLGVEVPATSHMLIEDVRAAKLANQTRAHRPRGGRERVARLVARLKREWNLTG